MVQLADAAAGAVARLESALPPGFPEHVWRTITDGIARHRQLFLDSSAAAHKHPDSDG
jgi:hypothetical protein